MRPEPTHRPWLALSWGQLLSEREALSFSPFLGCLSPPDVDDEAQVVTLGNTAVGVGKGGTGRQEGL